MIKQTAGRDGLGDLAPKFAQLNDDVLFGQVWSREDRLSLRDRSMITVVALVSKGITDSSLKYHIQNAKNHGVTKTEMVEIITHIAFYVGWPNAWAVFPMVREVYAQDAENAKEPLFGLGQPNDAYAAYFIGQSWYQQWEQPARSLHPGDVVYIPPEVKHWHGAAEDWFSHVAIEIPAPGASNEWLEPVSDEEYNMLTQMQTEE